MQIKKALLYLKIFTSPDFKKANGSWVLFLFSGSLDILRVNWGPRLNFSPRAVGGAADSCLPQGLNHLSFIPPALLSGHLTGAPVLAILYCAGVKEETAEVCLSAQGKTLISKCTEAQKSGWLDGKFKNKIWPARRGKKRGFLHSFTVTVTKFCSIQV